MTNRYDHLRDLIPYATETQRLYVESVLNTGSIAETSRQYNVHYTTVAKAIDRLKVNSEHNIDETVPEGYHVKKTATLHRDPDPNSKEPLKWVSVHQDAENLKKACQSVIDGFLDEIPREPKVDTRSLDFSGHNKDWLNLYVLSDYHLGMYAWAEECGENWDTKKAEDLLFRWVDYSVDNSPNTKYAVFAQLGDLVHWDGLDPVTPAHHNVLDADTRFPAIVRVAIRAMRYMMRRLLEKHEFVHLVIADANHDPSSAVWLREWFGALYEDDPRATVDQHAGTYYAYEFGNTALFFHHGHKKRVRNVDTVFARQFREIYGRAKYCYGHVGHLHHRVVIESNLMVVEQHRTLSPGDAYSTRGGFFSDRDSQVITYSSKYGEVNRMPVTPEMLNDS